MDLVNLAKRYGEQTAVENVSLSIEPSEFVTFLGPSGSGKTTTLNMIAGFVDPTDGHILMDGNPIASLPPHRRNIGMVFQHYALFPHMSAFENVAFPLKQRKVGKAEIRERVTDALTLVRLEGLGGRYPRQLSGGQQQRVALARAIVFGPRILLMDEPLGALDKKLREWLQLEIKRIHRELGITFIYVTHDQEEALVLSDRIAVFSQGTVEQVGTAEELYERPATRFVAEFVGESNIFEGVVSDQVGQPGYVTIRGGDLDLLASSSAEMRRGQRAAIVVRPERMNVRPISAAPASHENVLRGTVHQIIYLGSSRKLEIRVAGDKLALVREHVGARFSVQEGDLVDIVWSADDAVLLPDGNGFLDDDEEPDGETRVSHDPDEPGRIRPTRHKPQPSR